MPENNPLHTEMRVRDYLKFRARLKGLSMKRSRERVDAVMQQCGLTEVRSRILDQLSKGFRQRVGLADALVHEPELVILDEPTIGLDPNQIRAVRQLIKDLGQNRTVLISSHILSEVEMTCGRVIILHQGRVLAADTPENLRTRLTGGRVIAEIQAPVDQLRECWAAVAEIEQFDLVPLDGDYVRCQLMPHPGTDLRPLVFGKVQARGWKLRELTRTQYSLEDIFVHVTRPEHEEES